MTEIILWLLAATIIVALGIYAGKLLFLLKQQNQRQLNARNKRITSMVDSIQTIAFAMQQQQCDYSEGAIRICRLLEALPIENIPDYSEHYPAIHKLFDGVRKFPTHEARNALSKKERRAQDKERQQLESEAESAIQQELVLLREFKV
ncbi:DUF2489 domain-containing protein [Glaciecola sp. MH2013]|uniref:DUF2489 domain-containing protein n=1 Tax=Glaciecola sp. MH2013 TaxID=2785524 RepID=UPI00189E977C|nr:DUF2489 domain-containing protein [Glaciecola sp. MH2013]MBF7074663.1 DUF2489 domain-containing protein [Glaciecola sp. MH2013]